MTGSGAGFSAVAVAAVRRPHGDILSQLETGNERVEHAGAHDRDKIITTPLVVVKVDKDVPSQMKFWTRNRLRN